jgi:hypothetical protein
VTVEAIRRLPDGGSRSVRRVTTAADGQFRIGGLSTGSHILTVICPDRPFREIPFEAVLGETKTLDVALAAGGRVRVTVKNAEGSAVPGARISILKEGAGVPFWAARSTAGGAQQTGPDGTLRCTGLPPGAFTVKAEKPGAGSGEAPATVVDGGEVDVEIRFGK